MGKIRQVVDGNVELTADGTMLQDLKDSYQMALSQIDSDKVDIAAATSLAEARVIIEHMLNREEKTLKALKTLVLQILSG